MAVTLPLLALVLLSLTTAYAQRAVSVNLPYLGDVIGDESFTAWTNRKVFQFRGLPYVLPPTGPRRFLPPVRYEESGLDINGKGFDARSTPRMCPQNRNVADLQAGNFAGDPEDCLFLNVFTPKLQCDNTGLLPVMMYISGGGLYEGSAEEFPPGYLLEKDVVVVVPQYRLAAFGFLSLQTDGIPGNVGFLDQLAALRWTKSNARKFCGDEERITVFGQSAGGWSVSLLLVSPLVEPGLFQRAIIQSGSPLSNVAVDDKPEVYASQLADILRGCQLNGACLARKNKPDDEAVLRSASAFEIVNAVQKLDMALLAAGDLLSVGAKSAVRQKAGTQKYLVPETDFVKIPPEKAVPLMAGVTANEGSFVASSLYDLFTAMGVQNSPQFLSTQLMDILIGFTGVSDVSGVITEAIRREYFGDVLDNINVTFADAAPGLIDYTSSLFIKGGVVRIASAMSKLENPVWLYSLRFLGKCSRFGYGEPTEHYPFGGGVAHSNDLLFLWPYFCPPPIPKPDERVVHIMTDLWTSFAADAKPYSTGVEWPSIKPGTGGPYLHIRPDPQIADDFIKREFHVAMEQSESRSKAGKKEKTKLYK